MIEQIAGLMQAKKLPMVADIRDESDHEDPIRLRIMPRSNRVDKDVLMSHLLATTELEKSYRLNVNVIGLNRRPQTIGLVELLRQWLDYRRQTVLKRLQHRLEQINDRLHILEGLLIVFLHLDEVIRIIRRSDDPQQELMRRFKLSEIQVEAILSIRLRQLARLEELKLKREKSDLEAEKKEIEGVLASERRLKSLIKRELQADAEKFGDERRTRIVARREAQAIKEKDLAPVDPVTVVLSANGWVRAAKGHDIDPEGLTYKPGDAFLSAARGRSNQAAVFMDSTGRTYSLEAHNLPSARGQGEPITARFALPPGARFVSVAIGAETQKQLLASDFGYGFVTELANLQSKNQKGKAMLKVPAGANALPALPVDDPERQHLAAVTSEGYLLAIALKDLPVLPKGKGNKIVQIPRKKLVAREEVLRHLVVFDPAESLVIQSGKRTFRLTPEVMKDYFGERGKRGRKLPRGFRSVDQITVERSRLPRRRIRQRNRRSRRRSTISSRPNFTCPSGSAVAAAVRPAHPWGRGVDDHQLALRVDPNPGDQAREPDADGRLLGVDQGCAGGRGAGDREIRDQADHLAERRRAGVDRVPQLVLDAPASLQPDHGVGVILEVQVPVAVPRRDAQVPERLGDVRVAADPARGAAADEEGQRRHENDGCVFRFHGLKLEAAPRFVKWPMARGRIPLHASSM